MSQIWMQGQAVLIGHGSGPPGLEAVAAPRGSPPERRMVLKQASQTFSDALVKAESKADREGP